MIIVETPVSALDMEAAMLDSLTEGTADSLYVLGAMQAINWIKDGAKSPSEIIRAAKASGALN